MADLLSWLGQGIGNIGNAVGGAVNSFFSQPQQPPQAPQIPLKRLQQPLQAPNIAQPLNLAPPGQRFAPPPIPTFNVNPFTQNQTVLPPQPPSPPTAPPQVPNNQPNPIGALINTAAQGTGNFLQGVANTANIIPASIESGIGQLTGNKQLQANGDTNVKNNYEGSFIPGILNTAKIFPDSAIGVAARLTSNKSLATAADQQLVSDAHNSLAAPIISTYDAGNAHGASVDAQNAYTKANADAKVQLQQLNNAEASGKLSHADAVNARNVVMANLNKVGSVANAATSKFSQLDPTSVASNAATAALTLEPGIKGTAKVVEDGLNKLSNAPINTPGQAGSHIIPGKGQQPLPLSDGSLKNAPSDGLTAPQKAVMQPQQPNTQLPSKVVSGTSEVSQVVNPSSNSDFIPKENTKQIVTKPPVTPPQQIADALGIPKSTIEQSQKLESKIPQEQVPQSTSSKATKNNIAPEQIAVDNQSGNLQKGNSKLSSSDSKYTPNTTNVNIDQVNPGDYQKVRSNFQRVESNVNIRAREAIHSVNKLSPDEKANFWNVVERTAPSTSAKMTQAVNDWHNLSDHIHAASQALGGDTPHLANYARHNWDLSDPAEAQRFTDLMNQKFGDKSGRTISPEDFKGLDNKPRTFDTIAQGQAQGFKLKNEGNPGQDIAEYSQSTNSKLKSQSVAKSMQEAEAHIPDGQKSVSQHIGYKSNINVTPRGAHELRALFEDPQPKYTVGQKAVGLYDKANKGVKAMVLSLSQFHTGNIGMQATSTLLTKGHPIRALKSAVDTVGSTFSPKYSDNIIRSAIKDGTFDKAAQIGTPIMSGSDFNVSGKLDLNAVRGEKLVFERQLPAMHVQMAKAVIGDLQKKGIPLDSPQARAAGNEVHQIMGYVNSTLLNMSARNMRGAGRVMLAPNFTLSKWAVLKDAFTKGGQAGAYARSAVAGKYLMEAALIAAGGAIVGQTSDHSLGDVLLRALIHPSIPTPFKDSKGNNLEFGLPSNYLSEAAGLVSTLQRNKDGNLGANFNPKNIPQNLENYGQGRLAAIPSVVLKVATNKNFGSRPLYDPNAPIGTQFAQGATTLGVGMLPIGLQNLAFTDTVKNAAAAIPGVGNDIKNVLNAETPGSNPLVKGVASALGLTARTDNTTGQGLQTTQYFNALDKAKSGLNRQAADAIDMFTGSKKNPVTGAYDVQPNANDSRAKATALLDNTSAIDHLITMNQTLAGQGQKVDPLFLQSKDRIISYLQYQAMPPGSADRTAWVANNPWYMGNPNNKTDTGLAGQRTTFFNSLPAGDPNKPKLNIQYPDATPALQSTMDAYGNLTNSTDKHNFINAHPELLKQWKNQSDYTNQMRSALGYSPLKGAPEATPTLQSYMDKYNSADKATRKAIRNSDPSGYQSMIGFYDSLNMYNINKSGALDQLQGQPDQTSKQNKAIQSVARDIYQNPDGTYQIYPAGWMNGMSNGSGSSYGKRASNKGLSLAKAAYGASNGIKIPKFKAYKSTMPKVAKMPSMRSYSQASSKIPKIPTIRTRKGIA